jgi:hypothetical protein
VAGPGITANLGAREKVGAISSWRGANRERVELAGVVVVMPRL